MIAPKKALLLVGSPKGQKSTSQVLGSYLLNRLQGNGLEVDTVRLYAVVASDRGEERLLAGVRVADILILAFPLYADSLPSFVIKALELVARDRQSQAEPKRQTLMAIVNCGFPQAAQCDTALAICRRFAHESGVEWAGGLALGGGGVIDGQPLENFGDLMRNVRAALDLAASALGQGEPAPQEAVELMNQPLLPAWTTMLMGTLGWHLRARKNGVWRKLYARPYLVR